MSDGQREEESPRTRVPHVSPLRRGFPEAVLLTTNGRKNPSQPSNSATIPPRFNSLTLPGAFATLAIQVSVLVSFDAARIGTQLPLAALHGPTFRRSQFLIEPATADTQKSFPLSPARNASRMKLILALANVCRWSGVPSPRQECARLERGKGQRIPIR